MNVQIIDLYDELAGVNRLLEAAHMATAAVPGGEGDAIASVVEAAQDKLKAIKAALEEQKAA